jgi:large subunit ribosomal protein L23
MILYDKIKGLIYTEKSNKQLADSNKYCFEVDSSSTKKTLSALIQKIFSVDVLKINMINCSPRVRKFKGVEGKSKSYKKAIVTLKEGQTINFGN